jgi:sugar lactone lactonase YvrE
MALIMGPFQTLATGLAFGEGPRWRNGRLYVSDMHARRVIAVDLDGGVEVVAEVPRKPSGLGFLPDGRMLIASMEDRTVLRREPGGTLVPHADLNALAPWHINDMLVDAEGRAWVGNFGFDLHGGGAVCDTVLIAVEPDGTSRVAAEGLGFPNGMALTPDGGTLIVAETTGNRLSAFPLKGGELGERRTWAEFGPRPEGTDAAQLLSALDVVPDGICLDAEGAVWVADPLHGRLLRVAEGGRILTDLPTPGTCPFACMLGGEDRKTLFVCVAPTYIEAELVDSRLASIVMTRVEVAGAGLP